MSNSQHYSSFIFAHFFIIFVCTILFFLANPSFVYAQEYKATITSRSEGGNWHRASTWLEERIPTVDDIVEIHGVVTLDRQTVEMKGLVVAPGSMLRGKNKYHLGGVIVTDYLFNKGAIGGYLHTIRVGGVVDNQGIINPWKTVDIMEGSLSLVHPLFIPARLKGDIVAQSNLEFSSLESDGHSIDMSEQPESILTLAHSKDDLEVLGSTTIVFATPFGETSSMGKIMAPEAVVALFAEQLVSRGDITAKEIHLEGALKLDNTHLQYSSDITIAEGGQLYGESIWVLHSWIADGDIINHGIIGPDVHVISWGDFVNTGTYRGQKIYFKGEGEKQVIGDFPVTVELRAAQQWKGASWIHTLRTRGHTLTLNRDTILRATNIIGSKNLFEGKGEIVLVDLLGNLDYSPAVGGIEAREAQVTIEANNARLLDDIEAQSIEFYGSTLVSDNLTLAAPRIYFDKDALLQGASNSKSYRVDLETDNLEGAGYFSGKMSVYLDIDIPLGFRAGGSTNIYLQQKGYAWAGKYRLVGSIVDLLEATLDTALSYRFNLRDALNSGEQHFFSYLSPEGWSRAFAINAEPREGSTLESIAQRKFFELSFVGNQNVNQAFNLIVTTPSEPQFNGRVSLGALEGQVTPQEVVFVDGRWQGDVALNHQSGGEQLVVEGRHDYRGLSGRSNYFEVVGSSETQGRIRGVVREGSGKRADHGSIALYNLTTHHSSKVPISPTGEYEVTLDCGRYRVDLTNGISQEVTVSCGETVVYDFVYNRSCRESDKVPVLLVPGIQGSDSSSDPLVIFPELTARTPRWDEGALHLHDPFASVGWGDLVSSLEEEGYELGCTIFPTPYDWSLVNYESRKQFLEPMIRHAKAVASSTQVDIVAHSMGGLVAREYIQSSDYAGDVRKLALVGTPNQGATSAYFSWEGGDTMAADSYGGSWFEDTLSWLSRTNQFQTKTTAKNYQIKTGASTPLCLGAGPPLDYLVCDRVRTKKFLAEYAPSVGELYPTYNFLYDSASREALTPRFENSFLRSLNQEVCSGLGCTSYAPLMESGVEVELFIGLEENNWGGRSNTLSQVYVSPDEQTGYDYTDGAVEMVEYSAGDGTVLVDSVQGVRARSEFMDAEHSELIVQHQLNIKKFFKK